jgi:hypothetical protein
MSDALLKGSCHCGTVKSTVHTPASAVLPPAQRCNRSLRQFKDRDGANSAASAAI